MYLGLAVSLFPLLNSNSNLIMASSSSSSSRTKSKHASLCACNRNSQLLTPSKTAASSISDYSFARATSPTRVKMYAPISQSPPSIRFDRRPDSPSRPISVSNQNRRTCTCSPTTHPGSFRCAFHRSIKSASYGGAQAISQATASAASRLNYRRSAMTNSLVRIGGVEGEWVKRALSALIRPSSHQLRRRAAFQPRPSRLSVMSTALD